LLWLRSGARLRFEAKIVIAEAISSRTLFLSQIFLWELGLAMLKNRVDARPDLGGLSVDEYVAVAKVRYGIRFAAISDKIASEAPAVPAIYGFGDPGDCFLITTAHVEDLALITRDTRIIDLANRRPDYLTVIPC
jgi:PIN domain nuclease of toxin-antitoxin system